MRLWATVAAVTLLSSTVLADEPVCEAPIFRITGEIDLLDTVEAIVGIHSAGVRKYPRVDVVIDSPGGDTRVGERVIDAMKFARAQGTEVRCVVTGQASSMAAIILEAGCSTRAMKRSAYLLFHEAYYAKPPPARKAHELYHYANELADDNKRFAVMIAWRMGMSAPQYLAWIAGGRDQYVDAAEALERGFIDEVL